MKLELVSMEREKSPIVLDQFPVIFGLDPGSDVCLDDSSVGHYQCMIDDNDGLLTVYDLGTKTGTTINGTRVSKKASLMSGDELGIGKNRFTAYYGDDLDKGLPQQNYEARGGSCPPASPHHHRRPAVPV
jgi:pSer/pThr/pTyr-binding forkhead associated (FHA) protein